METTRLEELEARLARAEGELAVMRRRARWLGGLCVAALAGGALLSARPALTQNRGTLLRAPVRVVDDQNATLAELGTSGVPYLRLFKPDRSGTPAVEVFASRWGGGMDVRNEAGKVVAVLDNREQGVHLAILDKDGRVVFKRP
jgi:hypothetical protein